jgi:hypothetical protein
MGVKEYGKAIEVLNEVRKLAAFNPETECRLGISHMAEGMMRKARTSFELCAKKAKGVKGMEHLTKLAAERIQQLPPLVSAVEPRRKSKKR